MRILLTLSQNSEPVPYNYNHSIASRLNHWLGKNNRWHGKPSLSSFSRLSGGKATNEGLDFKFGSSLVISSYDNEWLMAIVEGIHEDPLLDFGMVVKDIQMVQPPDFDSRETLVLGESCTPESAS